MSMHPSLKATEKGKKQRSVLKRIERLKWMWDREKWKEGDSVYGLQKIKTIKIKIKKEKAEKAAEPGAEAAVAETAAPVKEAAPQAGKETKEAKKTEK